MHTVVTTPIDLVGHGNWPLHGTLCEPSTGLGARSPGLVVAGHAMMVDHRTLWRPDRRCLGNTLIEHGFSLLLPDQRGHGGSVDTAHAKAPWSYDDLVEDVGLWWQKAQAIAAGRPIYWLGHSLWGHVSLAYFGSHAARLPSAFVAIAVNVWGRQFEPSALIFMAQRLLMAGADGLVQLVGRMPARALRIGPCDESATYWRDLSGFARSNRWQSRQGLDYADNLRNVTMPTLVVVSDGDRWLTRPESAMTFAARIPKSQVLRLGRSAPAELAGLSPDHMGLVTSSTSEPIWRWIAGWLTAANAIGLGVAGPSPRP